MTKKSKPKKSDITVTVSSIDDARLKDPSLDWHVPVDLMTEMPDPETGRHQRLWSYELDFLSDYFGKGFMKTDIKIWLERQNLKLERFGWTAILRLVEQEKSIPPDDLMFTNVVLDCYRVSKNQLHKDIKLGVLKSYRKLGSKKHRLSEKEVSKTYTKKER